MKKLTIAMLAGTALLCSRPLRAGVVLQAEDLSPSPRKAFRSAISQAKIARPELFRELAALRRALPGLAASKRGRVLSLTQQLVSAGPALRHALVDELAFAGAGQGDLSAVAWQGWRMSVIEALGRLRRPELAPILRAALAKMPADQVVRRASIAALARLGDLADVPQLIRAATASDSDTALLLSALGECRRTQMVEEMIALWQQPRWSLAARFALLKGLAALGNAWAWRTPVVRQSGEENAVRSLVASTLVTIFAKATDAALRERAAKSVLIVGWGATPGLIDKAALSYSERLSELSDLALRFSRSPVR
jgi:HEAT repeat protein